MRILIIAAAVWMAWFANTAAGTEACIDCHQKLTPGLVVDWQLSGHKEAGVGCDTCHGVEHTTAEDAAKAGHPTVADCGECHEAQVEQFSRGKHALAWAAMEAMPTTHALPVALTQGLKGCGGCHKIGLKSNAKGNDFLKEEPGFGHASCASCHTRHAFSRTEARQPQACQTCHQGFDHPQWEMYASSKHGVRFLLRQNGTLPEDTPAPTCQTCHMPQGDHEVRTPWGFLAVRLPLPEDEQWRKDQVTILQALGVLDPSGEPTARLDVVKQADVARLTQKDFEAERQALVDVCTNCHVRSFVLQEFTKGDDLLRQVDHLMAEAIRIVAALYAEGLLKKPDSYAFAFPDLLALHDAPTRIEERLFTMFLKHRMRAFQGAFHANPEFALWHGWSEMVRTLTEIRELAADIRRRND